MKLLFSIALGISLFSITQLTAQEAQIVPVKLSDNFYVLYGGNGQGSNVGLLIEEEGIVLIDAMVEDSGEKLLAAIRKVSDKPIRYVFNTHGDFDHSGGNRLFAEQGAQIIAHQYAKYNGGWSQITFDKEFSLRFGNEIIRAWHSPCHANSDITIYLENQDAVFLGDTFTNTWHPTFYARGMAGQYQVLDLVKTIANKETKVVPGHGFIASISELDTYRKSCEAWMTRMTVLHNQGKNLEEMIADNELGQLRKQFIARRSKGDMPDMNFQRLIQRTVSSEFVKQQPMSESTMNQFTGEYRASDGTITRLFIKDGILLAAVDGESMTELLPVAANRFHLRASIDGYFSFRVSDGTMTISHTSGESQSLLTRVDDH